MRLITSLAESIELVVGIVVVIRFVVVVAATQGCNKGRHFI